MLHYASLLHATLSYITFIMLQYMTFSSHYNTLQYNKLSCIPLSKLLFIIFSVVLPYLIPHFPSLHYNTLYYVALCYIPFLNITLLTFSHVAYPTLHYFIQPYLKLHFSYATLSYTRLSFYHYNNLQYVMLHNLPLSCHALHLPSTMLSYYISCCPLLHYPMLCYVIQHYIKLHCITLPCLISHLVSLPLLYPELDCTTSLYAMLIYASLCLLCYNMFHILMIF